MRLVLCRQYADDPESEDQLPEYDLRIKMIAPDEKVYFIHVNVRPGVVRLLQKLQSLVDAAWLCARARSKHGSSLFP